MKAEMTREEIEVARKWLTIKSTDSISDEMIRKCVTGTFTHSRIRLRLTFIAFAKALNHALFGRFAK